MNKAEDYQRLVQQRKACTLSCQGLCKPSTACDGRHDSNQIGPWSLWQGYLDAQVVVVGQDWGDVKYFKKWEGRDQGKGNRTNDNLRILLRNIGLTVNGPRDDQAQMAFFTNLILCLKTRGGLQGDVVRQWFDNCSHDYFEPLMEIIKPKVVLALGRKTTEAILRLYRITHPKDGLFSVFVDGLPIKLPNNAVLFPLYHCGAWGVYNRHMPEQVRDWQRVSDWMQGAEGETRSMVV